MKKSSPSDDKPAPEPAPFAAFDALTRKIMAVPKAEIDKMEAEYQKEREKKPKRGSKGK